MRKEGGIYMQDYKFTRPHGLNKNIMKMDHHAIRLKLQLQSSVLVILQCGFQKELYKFWADMGTQRISQLKDFSVMQKSLKFMKELKKFKD